MWFWNTYKDYIIIGGALLVFWDLISYPMTREEARASRRVRFTHELISLAAVAAVVWFAWWLWFNECLFACGFLGYA